MILDQPIDPIALQQLSETEKIKLLKAAYLEALQVIQQSQQKKYHLLSATAHTMDQHQINRVKQIIESI